MNFGLIGSRRRNMVCIGSRDPPPSPPTFTSGGEGGGAFETKEKLECVVQYWYQGFGAGAARSRHFGPAPAPP